MDFGAKIRAGLMAGMLTAVCLLFCSCSPAPLLSQREIVYAVFFQKQEGISSVLLLLADSTQTGESAEPAYRSVTGRGQTPVQALEQAEGSLKGQVFYGLMDLAVLPAQCDWKDTEEIVRLLYNKTKPAPQIVLFMLKEQQGPLLLENAARIYEDINYAEQHYGLNNGLQMALSRKNECALPQWQGTGYGFVFLQKDKPNTVLEDPISAQLAAVLTGQADCLDFEFAQGNAALQTQATVQCRADSTGANTLHLTLENPEITDMSGQMDQNRLGQTLCNELEQAYSGFVAELYTGQFDPLRTRVWVAASDGILAQIPRPQLVVHLET